jgi:thioredoxin reductase/bacterioferritin-associated ferredoxin
MTVEIEVLVVGGGPSGLAAAAEAAQNGAEVLLVDEGRITGGSLARLGDEPVILDGRSTSASAVHDSIQAAARAADVTILRKSLVWSVFPDRSVAVVSPGESIDIRPQALVIAPGAVDVLFPFEGWTLPGVLTAKEALNLVFGTQTRLGRNAVIVGAGGRGVPVAMALRSAGQTIAGLAESETLTDAERSTLQEAGIPVFESSRVLAVHGEDYVETIRLSTINGYREFDAETLILATRQFPQIELSSLADCEIRWAPHLAMYVPSRSSNLQSSVPGIFIAGAGGEICGLGTAIAEGRLAGVAVAAFLRRDTAARLRPRVSGLESIRTEERPQVRRGMIASRRLEVEAVKEALANPEMILCRCEEVPVRKIREAINMGARIPGEVKRATRIGMGECQGRNCRFLLSEAMAQITGSAYEDLPPLTYRPPVRPLTIGALVQD